MSGVLTIALICSVLVVRDVGLAALVDDEFQSTYTDTNLDRDRDATPDESSPTNLSPLQPTFDDSSGDSPDDKSVQYPSSYWNKESSETSTEKNDEEIDSKSSVPQKNIFIYVPFRAKDSRQPQHGHEKALTTSTTRTTTTTTPKPTLLHSHPTLRTTFSSAWPPMDSPSLRSISRSSPEYKGQDKWKPVSGLRESASSSVYTQAAVPVVRAPTQILQSPPTVLLAPQQHVFQQQPVFQHVQAVQDVRVVQDAQPQPVHVDVVQSAPPAAPPVHLNIVRAPPAPPPAIHVNFVRAQPQTIVQQPVLHAPIVQQRFVQSAPVHTHFVQSPIVHAHPVVHAPAVLRAPLLQPTAFIGPAAPPCAAAAPVFQPAPIAFFSPPHAQRTRTVLQQVQFVPEQTHVFTTTSFSPATRTTIYESDHVAAFSAPKAHYVRAPTAKYSHSPPAFVADRDTVPATIFTFPKMGILGAPLRFGSMISSRRLLRQRLRQEMLKEKHKKAKEKKIFVFNRRNSD